MKAITHHGIVHDPYTEQYVHVTHKSLWKRFIEYCESQEEKRMWWMTLGILGHGTLFTIATLAIVELTGNVFALFVIACCAMVISVVVNLAAQPTKYTIPVFFLSLIVDLGVIITAVLLH